MNEIVTPQSLGLSREDLPNSYIGRAVPRPNARKLVEGRATYTDDVTLPRLVHAAFLRSPHAHARIVSIDASEALKVQAWCASSPAPTSPRSATPGSPCWPT
ncbi:MAG: hypothetical protein Q8S29_07230 [Phreatobacter sp.]|nr:hypothetical protein [Phreatobacter sp.]